jgi:CDP-2,3-bis-(O-geranylgeranyl)-sn-glycerol synthase
MDILIEFVKAFWILFPAFAANMFPVLAKGKYPIDFKKNLGKYRILGNGKTFEGFGLGLIAGFLIGILELSLYPTLNVIALQNGFSLPTMNLSVAFLIPFGALFGDLIGSFIKRRIGLKRGKKVILLDQLDFIIGAILFAYLFTEITVWMILIMLIVTVIIHRLSCIIGYKLKLKREPW